MMSTNKYASRLRHGLHSAVLGGAALDTMIDETELEKLERGSKTFSEQEWFWNSPEGMAQSIFVVLDEPGTSKLATIFSLYMQVCGVDNVVCLLSTTVSGAPDRPSLSNARLTGINLHILCDFHY